MKKTLTLALVAYAAAFATAGAAHALGYIRFDVLTPVGIAGTLVVAALVAFACVDYRRRRAFRVRRPKPPGGDPLPTVPPPDWTYTTRSR